MPRSDVLNHDLPRPLGLWRFSKRYCGLAVATLLVEILIALGLHDRFIRPLVGDALAVLLLYASVLTVLRLPKGRTLLATFVFACCVELAQYFHVVDVLGLAHNRFARTVIGTSFDPRDFVAYALGACGVLWIERRWAKALS